MFATTRQPMQRADLDQLRQHLEFEQINLVGGSYGTRMAQAYLRHYPDAVRSVVIDGVVPTRLHLGSEHGMKLDQSLYRLFDQCREDATCAERFPDLDQALQNLIAHYQQETEALIVTHPRTGQGIPVDFSNDVLASALRFLAYNPQTQMIIPYLIHEAATTGSPSRLASQALIVQDQMSDQIAIGLNFAVGCSEDWPGWPHDLDQSGTLLGNSMREFYETVCAWWPAGEVADDFHQPFASDVPMLVLSGELDPVTPPEYGDEAAEQFDNSLHLIGRGLGHIVLGQPCFGKIITQFIDQASVGDLDTDCLDQLGPEPFFRRLAGADTMIEANHLRKTFNKGKVVAVDDVSFHAMDGQITGLLGPNGAGKTTTLRMLYTLLKPDSGNMRVDGIDPESDPLKVKRALGVVPDSRGLYDRLTAREKHSLLRTAAGSGQGHHR